MIVSTVFLFSLSALMLEVLLTRCFAISQWYHLAFMVISLALLGFAASGILLSLTRNGDRQPWWLQSRSSAITLPVVYALFTLVTFQITFELPLDYFRMIIEPWQWRFLAAAYLLLATPFFFAGWVIGAAYAAHPEKAAMLYLAGMSGSAVGALLPAIFLSLWPPEQLVGVSALIPAALMPPAAACWTHQHLIQRYGNIVARCAAIMAGVGVALLIVSTGYVAGSHIKTIKPSVYKAQSQLMQLPHSRIAATRATLRGLCQMVQSPFLRQAPGLSLHYQGRLPTQTALFLDGDNPVVLYDIKNRDRLAFARLSLLYAGYELLSASPRVLILQQNGGSGLICALAAGARQITLIDENPLRAAMVANHYPLDHLRVINPPARHYLAQTHQRYDLIQIDSWGASLLGSAALFQTPLLTIEALRSCLQHLTDSGLLVLARRLLLPPSDSLRMWATAYEALLRMGITNPSRHMAMLRSFDTYVLLVGRSALANPAALDAFAQRCSFDWVHGPGRGVADSNRFNRFEEPFHSKAVDALQEAYRQDRQDHFFAQYLLDVRPATDARPFAGRIIHWRRLTDLIHSTGNRYYSLFLSTEVVVPVVLLQAVGVSLILLLLPLTSANVRRHPPPLGPVLYFLLIGLGYILSEMFFIQAFARLFGDEIVSLAVMLPTLLAASAFGARLTRGAHPAAMRILLGLLIAALSVTAVSTGAMITYLEGYPVTLSGPVSLLLILPVGILLGTAFPMGMGHLLPDGRARAIAWAANGCGSVTGAVLAAQVAMVSGIPMVAGLAALCYFGAIFCLGRRARNGGTHRFPAISRSSFES
jgi:hypothetical protein